MRLRLLLPASLRASLPLALLLALPSACNDTSANDPIPGDSAPHEEPATADSDTSGDALSGDTAAGDVVNGDARGSGDGTTPGDATSGDPIPAGDAPVTFVCAHPPASNPTDVSVTDLYNRLQAGDFIAVVDVREPSEHTTGIIAGALLYPRNSGVLAADHANLPDDRPLYIICQSGGRSALASQFLADNGHSCVHNVLGGMTAWDNASYPTVSPEDPARIGHPTAVV